ncbi:MAG: M48 family metallopeptidase [Desulfohalobiaceae bacterium]|nr:M48 family metallopeptidase [Desulfohalobiaceae bacterium]
MNVFLLLIIAAVIMAYAVDNLADYLNIRHLDPVLPREFSDIFDQEQYARSQEYARLQTRLRLIQSTVNCLCLLLFLLCGGLSWLDQLVRTLALHPVWTGLIFFAVLGLALDLLSLPFELYDTFVLEQAFGFNRSTPGLFVKDKLKGYLLAVLIGGPVLAGVLLALGRFPEWGWLWAWLLITLVMLLLHAVGPSLILPLFNTFTPLEPGQLRDKIEALARNNRFDLSGIFVMDGSKRSTKSNAFFTGLGRTKRIALFDTLIERHSVDELVAVLAHEIGHFQHKHILKQLLLSCVKTGILLYLIAVLITFEPLFAAFELPEPRVYTGLVFFALLYTPVSLLLSLGLKALSRKYEYQADAFAARATRQAGALIAALKKLSADNLSNLTPHPLYVLLNYSHPPVLQRIRALQQTENS